MRRTYNFGMTNASYPLRQTSPTKLSSIAANASSFCCDAKNEIIRIGGAVGLLPERGSNRGSAKPSCSQVPRWYSVAYDLEIAEGVRGKMRRLYATERLAGGELWCLVSYGVLRRHARTLLHDDGVRARLGSPAARLLRRSLSGFEPARWRIHLQRSRPTDL